MKSKSFNLASEKQNSKTDFVGLYKSVAETNTILSNLKLDTTQNGTISSEPFKSERSPKQNKKKPKKHAVDLAQISIDGSNLNKNSGHSTPINKDNSQNGRTRNKDQVPAVKSIMKTNVSTNSDDNMVDTSLSASRRKKRNKSVSFMLEDEEVVIKKTKSEDTVDSSKKNTSVLNAKKESKVKKSIKKKSQAEKENKVNIDNVELLPSEHLQKKIKTNHKHLILKDPETSKVKIELDKKLKLKKNKKDKKSSDNSETTESTNNDQSNENKEKKHKKKKRKGKSVEATGTQETDGEPKMKSSKTDMKPEVIAENLENLSIGENANTLSSLLDDMTVAVKNKKKKNKQKNKKIIKDKQNIISTSSSDTADLKKIEEGREKVIWRKRKWNKDKKVGANYNLHTSIIVENLPLSILFTYKKLLTEHFSDCGSIKRIGVAEVYPLEESKPVFTTTVVFENEDSAMKALEEDNSVLQDTRIRIKWPRPASETTLVVRSFAEMTDQNLSSTFVSAGKIRNIKQIIKGKNSMATAFVEFDGPEAVSRAMKLAEDVKIGGKKVHVSKFEQRTKKKSMKTNARPEHENEGDSVDSN